VRIWVKTTESPEKCSDETFFFVECSSFVCFEQTQKEQQSSSIIETFLRKVRPRAAARSHVAERRMLIDIEKSSTINERICFVYQFGSEIDFGFMLMAVVLSHVWTVAEYVIKLLMDELIELHGFAF
jgi:hypothetical protein